MFEDITSKAAGLMKDGNVQEIVEKVQEFANTEKGKEVIETIKEKAEEFFHKK